jgi:hypothetical protein
VGSPGKAAEADSHTGVAEAGTDGVVVEERAPEESEPDDTAEGSTVVGSTAVGNTEVGKHMLPAGNLADPKQASFEDTLRTVAGSTGIREGRSSSPPL